MEGGGTTIVKYVTFLAQFCALGTRRRRRRRRHHRRHPWPSRERKVDGDFPVRKEKERECLPKQSFHSVAAGKNWRVGRSRGLSSAVAGEKHLCQLS